MKKMVVVIWVLCLMASVVLAQTGSCVLTPQKLIDFPNGVWNLEFQKGEYYLFQGVLKNLGRVSTVELIELLTARDNTFPTGESGSEIFNKTYPLQFHSIRALLWRSSIDYQEGKLISQTTDKVEFKFNPVSLHMGDSIRVMVIGAIYDVSVDCRLSLDVKTIGQYWAGRVEALANQKIYFTKDGAAADLWHQGQFFYLLDSRLLVAWPKDTAPIGQRLAVKFQSGDSTYWASNQVTADGSVTFDFHVLHPNCRLVENSRRYTLYRQGTLSKVYFYTNTIRFFQMSEEGIINLRTRNGELMRAGVARVKFAVNYDKQYLRFMRATTGQPSELVITEVNPGIARIDLRAPKGSALIGGDKIVTFEFRPTSVGSSRVEITNFWVYTDKDSLKMFDLTEVLSYSGVFTSVQGQQSLPYEYQLAQNYPNPFNGETVIAFQLREPGLTSLNIYNLSGQLVAKLVDQKLAAGSHTVKFSSQLLPSGMYLYSIQSGSFRAVKKFTIMK